MREHDFMGLKKKNSFRVGTDLGGVEGLNMITVKIVNGLFSNLVPPAHFTCVKLFGDGGGLVWFWVLLAALELSKPD